jgi:hypothetical protein
MTDHLCITFTTLMLSLPTIPSINSYLLETVRAFTYGYSVLIITQNSDTLVAMTDDDVWRNVMQEVVHVFGGCPTQRLRGFAICRLVGLIH